MLVGNFPETIRNLQHNLTFATDDEVNELIITRYIDYDYLSCNNTVNRNYLQDVINRWSDYFNQLWKTAGYTINSDLYDPLQNYNGTETEKTTLDIDKTQKRVTDDDSTTTDNSEKNVKDSTSTNSSSNGTYQTNRYGFNTTSTGTPTSTQSSADTANSSTSSTSNETIDDTKKTERDVSETTTNDDIHKTDRTLTTSGKTGTETYADMLQSERDLIINFVSDYVDKFAECFTITWNCHCAMCRCGVWIPRGCGDCARCEWNALASGGVN